MCDWANYYAVGLADCSMQICAAQWLLSHWAMVCQYKTIYYHRPQPPLISALKSVRYKICTCTGPLITALYRHQSQFSAMMRGQDNADHKIYY